MTFNVNEAYARMQRFGRRCDSCGATLPQSRRYRCEGCPPPPLPQAARDAIELAKSNAAKARESKRQPATDGPVPLGARAK
jgi:hypothetical protein